jgi:hypothetical protein
MDANFMTALGALIPLKIIVIELERNQRLSENWHNY